MIDMPPDQLATVRRILAAHVPNCEVRAFGSRVDGRTKPHSHLDIAIVGEGELEPDRLAAVREAFQESDLPIRIDVLDWHGITESFQRVITRNSEILQAGGM